MVLGIPLIGRDANTRLERTTDDETLVRKLVERYLEAVNTSDDATIAELNCAKAAPIDGESSHRVGIIRRDGVWCVRD